MFIPIISTLSLLGSAYAAGVIGPIGNLQIVNGDVAPDGFHRQAVLAGVTKASASFPGPLVIGTKGSRFLLNVVDNLTNATMLLGTSIHWHGIFQEKSSWADGPVGVTQCPISPGHSFLYDFKVPDQAGTFWYHSHYSTQYCDGLRGAFVIYDLNDPNRNLYDVDNESTVITLSDWYHRAAPFSRFTPPPDAALINGLGQAYDTTINSTLAVINVVRGRRYRFRLVSLSCFPNYNFSIDGHTMTIIEVDGINHQPLVVDSIQIFVGQRYSFVLNANQPVGNYWVRADPNTGTTGFAGNINSAILRYRNAPIANPNTTSTSTKPMLETNLHPTKNAAAPGGSGPPDVALNLNVIFNTTQLLFNINGAPFLDPTVPVLLQVLSGAQTAQSLLPPGSVYTLPKNSVIEISIPGGAPGFPHPFHLHGHAFSVVRSAGSTVYNYVNPVQRDVVSTGGSGDNVTFRFFTDNAGPWILHCHIDWHLTNGLAVVLAEDVQGIASSTQPPAWRQLCPTFDALPTNSR